MPAERVEADGVPCLVCPSVFALKVIPEISPVNVESEVGVEVPVVAYLVDVGALHLTSKPVCPVLGLMSSITPWPTPLNLPIFRVAYDCPSGKGLFWCCWVCAQL